MYVHTVNPVYWIGFNEGYLQDKPETNRWVLFNQFGVLYAADCPNQMATPPTESAWEAPEWAGIYISRER